MYILYLGRERRLSSVNQLSLKICNLLNFKSPTATDGHVVQMHVKIDVLFKHWLQHPGKKSGHLLHMLCHQGLLGTVCLQQDSCHMCIWPGYHLHHNTTKLGYSVIMKVDWRVEWCSVVFSDESRFCLYATDGRTHVRRRPDERRLWECILP